MCIHFSPPSPLPWEGWPLEWQNRSVPRSAAASCGVPWRTVMSCAVLCCPVLHRPASSSERRRVQEPKVSIRRSRRPSSSKNWSKVRSQQLWPESNFAHHASQSLTSVVPANQNPKPFLSMELDIAHRQHRQREQAEAQARREQEQREQVGGDGTTLWWSERSSAPLPVPDVVVPSSSSDSPLAPGGAQAATGPAGSARGSARAAEQRIRSHAREA